MSDCSDPWARVLAPLASRDARVLEIGSLVGESAVRFLTLLPRSRVTCVDPFTGDEFGGPAYNGDVQTLEARFDANVASFGNRVEKIKSRSVPALDVFAQSGRRFDVIFIDGSHRRDDVLMDSVLSWCLLEDGGILIWDDYLWNLSQDRPQRAIDAFLSLNREDLVVIHLGWKVIARKAVRDKRPVAPGWVFPRTVRNLFRFLMQRPIVGSDKFTV